MPLKVYQDQDRRQKTNLEKIQEEIQEGTGREIAHPIITKVILYLTTMARRNKILRKDQILQEDLARGALNLQRRRLSAWILSATIVLTDIYTFSSTMKTFFIT